MIKTPASLSKVYFGKSLFRPCFSRIIRHSIMPAVLGAGLSIKGFISDGPMLARSKEPSWPTPLDPSVGRGSKTWQMPRSSKSCVSEFRRRASSSLLTSTYAGSGMTKPPSSSSSADIRLMTWSSNGKPEDAAGALAEDELAARSPPTCAPTGDFVEGADSGAGIVSLAITMLPDVIWPAVRCLASARCRCCNIFCRRPAAEDGVASSSSSRLVAAPCWLLGVACRGAPHVAAWLVPGKLADDALGVAPELFQ
mmetsp:Transcript_35653/g.70516  ORF Transcript_35653/g.70516 Transcript_35653/m.70516 type:complete len:253 (+) Transcript_35653:695-1453(+)